MYTIKNIIDIYYFKKALYQLVSNFKRKNRRNLTRKEKKNYRTVLFQNGQSFELCFQNFKRVFWSFPGFWIQPIINHIVNKAVRILYVKLSLTQELLWNTSFNPTSVNFTKWSNTLKQFFGNRRRIVWVCLAILWGWRLES